ncbi:MAG: sulfotransferase [Pseudomonadales bacterium]|nr:sulfotransferase [Pseudomonadales bacterium]
MKPKPNLFIVGAPKCGTTTLHRILEQHPDICMSSFKEPHYFATDFDAPQYIRNERTYLNLFRQPDRKVVGESSPLYLYSDAAPHAIHKSNPDAKIIIAIRHPVDLVVSLHNALLANGKEDIKDLAEALELEQIRGQGKNLPRHCKPEIVVQYRTIARISERIRHYLEVFSPSQIFFCSLEELSKTPEQVLSEICNFLEIDNPNDDIVIDSFNSRKSVRSKFIQRMFVLTPFETKQRIKKLIPSPIIQFINQLNQSSKFDQVVDLETIEKLNLGFEQEVKALTELTGLCLTSTYQPSAAMQSK